MRVKQRSKKRKGGGFFDFLNSEEFNAYTIKQQSIDKEIKEICDAWKINYNANDNLLSSQNDYLAVPKLQAANDMNSWKLIKPLLKQKKEYKNNFMKLLDKNGKDWKKINDMDDIMQEDEDTLFVSLPARIAGLENNINKSNSLIDLVYLIKWRAEERERIDTSYKSAHPEEWAEEEERKRQQTEENKIKHREWTEQMDIRMANAPPYVPPLAQPIENYYDSPGTNENYYSGGGRKYKKRKNKKTKRRTKKRRISRKHYKTRRH
uniref:Uncharacterized protein n=1 Tax=viral metagenome TaxID=1070528 RepID=A0A6C0IHM6_9ZZZZ